MPTSHNWAGAPSTTFVKTWGDRDSPIGEDPDSHVRPSNANRRNGLCRGRIETLKHVSIQVDRCKPLLELDASDDAFLCQHVERNLMKGLIQCSPIQDRPKATTFLGHDEVSAVE